MLLTTYCIFQDILDLSKPVFIYAQGINERTATKQQSSIISSVTHINNSELFNALVCATLVKQSQIYDKSASQTYCVAFSLNIIFVT